MDGIRIAGKAFVVFEELRQIAEQNKGKTVAEFLHEQRCNRLERVASEIVGVTVEEYRGWFK